MKYHMAGLLCALVLASAGVHAQGNCVGSGYVYTCVDSAVNNAYQGVRPDTAAQMNGYQSGPGNTWHQGNQIPSPGYPLYRQEDARRHGWDGNALHHPGGPEHHGHHQGHHQGHYHHDNDGRNYVKPCYGYGCR